MVDKKNINNSSNGQTSIKDCVSLQKSEINENDSLILARGASTTLIGRILGRGIHFFTQILLARILGPADYGLYSLGWTIFRMVGITSPLGMDRSVIAFASGSWKSDRAKIKGILIQSVKTAFFSALSFSILFYLLAPWISNIIFKEPGLMFVIRGFSFIFIFDALSKVLTASTRATHQMKYTIYVEELWLPLTNIIFILIFSYLGFKLNGSIFSIIFASIISFIASSIYIFKVFPDIVKITISYFISLRDLLHFSIPVAISRTFATLILWVDRLILGYLRPVYEVGIYQTISQTSILFATILGAVNTVVAPIIADLYQKGEIRRLSEILKVSTKWSLYVSMPIFLVIFSYPREIITMTFGIEYADGASSLLILMVGQFVNVGTGSVGVILMMTKNQIRFFLTSSSMLIVSIILNGILIQNFGLLGAAISTSIATIGLNIISLFQVKKNLNIWIYDLRLYKGFIASIISALVIFILKKFIILPFLLHLIIVSITTLIVFAIVILFLGLDKEDQSIINFIKIKIFG